MARAKKSTVEAPPDLPTKAAHTGREGLEKIPRAEAYRRLLALEGKVHLSYDIEELREDRD